MLNETIEKRRSIYDLGKKEVVNSEKIVEIVRHAVKYCPTAFNSQSSRVVVLFGENHDKLWDIVLDTLKAMVPPKVFEKTEEKVNSSFKSGYGTVLFFEDQEVVENLQKQFPTYADNFPHWSEQASGMLQFTVWTSLAEMGVGASLQHYNPIIDNEVRKYWKLPRSWKLISEMPFGSVDAPADEKDFLPLESRVKVFG